MLVALVSMLFCLLSSGLTLLSSLFTVFLRLCMLVERSVRAQCSVWGLYACELNFQSGLVILYKLHLVHFHEADFITAE